MLRELRTLMAVAQAGSFAAAGARIGLTQAAVSAQMQRLEAALGFALFDRTGRSSRLNTRGQQTLARAHELMQLVDELAGDPARPAAGESLRIGAIASAQRTLLPAALSRFHQRLHGSHLRVVPGVSMALLDGVDAGELDLAVLIAPPFALQGDLRWTLLAREPYRLLVPAAAAGAGRGLGDDWRTLLTQRPFIRYDRASFGGRRVDRFLRDLGLAVRDVCELDELEAIAELVAHGIGVALVPQTASHRAWPEGVRAIELGEAGFHREIGLVHRPWPQLGAGARQLAQDIVDVYAGVSGS